ncbi:ParB/RepB/Spo0J family partition protein [Actinopolyspora saharensis]|uniref:ParB-like nuclease domain-containing protein n=1 Tax=Actinopolyspora saharensis TaxID=995062 RepID=A0A1H1FA65_9ACTN|nr:ParB N-terminal domain-containing protein [Actinopolyspora saharensis]SDQ97842.1 ParB-like nuclease domain-containing protein [Actinopolyspora saharensis]
MIEAGPASSEQAPEHPSPAAPPSVPLDALVEEGSPRISGINQNHVELLSELTEPLPPILVHRPTMRVLDGRHRLWAARRNGRDTVEVTYVDGTETEAFLLAVESNIRHGLPLSLSERKEAAGRILSAHPEWSDRAIAVRTGLSGKTVGALRRERAGEAPGGNLPEAHVGDDGRVRSLRPAEGRLRCRDVLLERGQQASLREVAREAGVSVETVRDVRARLSRGESPLPTGTRGSGTTGGSRRRNTARRSGRTVDPASGLDSLKQDPSVRYSDQGRAVVRWLETHMIREEETNIVRRVPAHQATQIAAIARACAASWDEIARELERGEEK